MTDVPVFGATDAGTAAVAASECGASTVLVEPGRHEARDLLVAVCVSASHVAFASLRMEPTLMVLGEACGVAAAQAARRGVAVQDVDVGELQETLRSRGAVLA